MTPTITKIEALKALDRIAELINHFGGPYLEDHREFKSLISILRNGPLQNSYFSGKLSELERQANDGFSIRSFLKHPGGVSQVRVWALGALSISRDLVAEHWPQS